MEHTKMLKVPRTITPPSTPIHMKTKSLHSMTRDELIAEVARLRVTEERYQVLLDNSSDAIFSINGEGQYLYVNKEFATNVCNREPDFIIGKKIWDIFSQDEADKRYTMVKWVFQNGKAKNIEVRVPTVDGDTFHLTTIKPIFDNRNKVDFIICISKDITDRKIMEEQLKYTAHYDSLTELPNRVSVNDHIAYAIQQAERNTTRLALMYIDLDNFKPVNDTFGHKAGDILLKEVARRLQKCLRESDTAARIGGDEFVVLLPVIDSQQDALHVAEKIRLSLSVPFELHGNPAIHISSSIGIALFPEHGRDEIQLSTNADKAMYMAKEQGRNTVKIAVL